jgi:hypothetical protein
MLSANVVIVADEDHALALQFCRVLSRDVTRPDSVRSAVTEPVRIAGRLDVQGSVRNNSDRC